MFIMTVVCTILAVIAITILSLALRASRRNFRMVNAHINLLSNLKQTLRLCPHGYADD